MTVLGFFKFVYSIENQEFWSFPTIAKKVAKFLGDFLEKYFCHRPKKGAKMAKFRHIWSHWREAIGTNAKRPLGQC